MRLQIYFIIYNSGTCLRCVHRLRRKILVFMQNAIAVSLVFLGAVSLAGCASAELGGQMECSSS